MGDGTGDGIVSRVGIEFPADDVVERGSYFFIQMKQLEQAIYGCPGFGSRCYQRKTGGRSRCDGFEKVNDGKAAKRVCEKGVHGAILIVDCPEGIYVQGQRNLFATGFAMCRRVEGQYFISFLNKSLYVYFEILRGRFKSMYYLQ